jgi:hypothetical protein
MGDAALQLERFEQPERKAFFNILPMHTHYPI